MFYYPLQKYFAEFLGTFLLVFVGTGTAVLAGPQVGYIGVAVAFGLTLMVIVYTLGPISGAHVNPGITLGLFMAKKFEAKMVVPYMLAQMVGAIVAGYLVFYIASQKEGFDIAKGFALNGFGAHSPLHYSVAAGMILEVFMMALLMIVVMVVVKEKVPFVLSGLLIGTTLLFMHLISIPVTNTSVNFARTVGVAVVHGGWAVQQLWLFAVAHVIGVFLGLGILSFMSSKTS